MNDLRNSMLEDRLREHFERRTAELPEHGPGLDGAMVLRDLPDSSARSPWIMGLLAAAAIAVVVVAGAVISQRGPDGDASITTATNPDGAPSSPSSPPDSPAGAPDDSSVDAGTAELGPVATLPDTDVSESPVTVAATSPVDWYRFAPDLDVSWYLDPSGTEPSMFCWRTPAVDEPQCSVDAVGSSVVPLVVPTAGDQILVLGGSTRADDDLTVELDDGTVLRSPQIFDDIIEWGVARFELPTGRRIVAVDGTPIAAASAEAFCAVMADLAGERPEAYVGSAEHVDDVAELLAVSPVAISGDVQRYVDFLESGFIDSVSDPRSNEVTNWPADVQESVADIQSFVGEVCS